jgi:hypothetical protein
MIFLYVALLSFFKESRLVQSARLSVSVGLDDSLPRAALMRLSSTYDPQSLPVETSHSTSSEKERTRGETSREATAGAVNMSTEITTATKCVSFHSVTIIFFGCTFGESVPSSGGPALGLSWEAQGCVEYSVEEMEELRGGNLPEAEEEVENEVIKNEQKRADSNGYVI